MATLAPDLLPVRLSPPPGAARAPDPCGLSQQHQSLAGLLGLTDELLLKILHSAGAPAVARAATLCRRLRHAQQQLAALPAFASAAVLEDDM